MEKRVVVIGGGVAGLTASLTAAELGKKVLLIENSPFIGGMLEKLDTWFTDDACGMCQILPQFSTDEKLDRCLRRDFYHPLIDIRTLTEVKSIEDTKQGRVVTLIKHPRYVDEIKCTGCMLCEQVCPEEGPNSFDKGFSKHKAIHTLYTGNLTKTYYIDKNICTECGKCVEICPTKAIDLNQKETEEKIIAKSIIVTTGFSEINPANLTSFGYGRFKNVLTSLDFERLISRASMQPDELKRPSDGKIPSKVAFIQCVGSRDKDREYCSGACCMYAIKEARKIKEISKDTDVCIFYMDLRTFGKGHYTYYLDAEKKGVSFKNFRIPSVSENSDGDLLVEYEENGKMKSEKFGLIILSTGQEINEDTKKLLDALGVEKDKYGFVIPQDFETFRTLKKDIYVAGSLGGPKDIESTVIEARSAGFLAVDKHPETEEEEVPLLPIDYRTPKFGIFICNCGGVISKDVDIEKVKKSLEVIPDVNLVEEVDFVCQGNRLDKIMEKVKNKELTRIIFATCSPAKYEVMIRKVVKHYGFNQGMIEILPLREQIAWAYDSEREQVAVRRIQALIEKQRYAIPTEPAKVKGKPRAVIIGAGLAGMVASTNLSNKGIKTEIIEKSDRLGGNARKLSTTLEGENVTNYLEQLTKKVTNDKNITIHYGSELASLEGNAGDFLLSIKNQKNKEMLSIPAGAIIVATGSQEYKPTEYSYGKDARILTQLELEEKITNNQLPITNKECVVMIQCVGSRNDEHPWCSKVCCSDAIKNALILKEKNKDIDITILYRDIMTYGKKELKYSEAREQGINFVRFNRDEEPDVSVSDGKITITVMDTILQKKLQYEPDLLVLSTGIVPYDNNLFSEIIGVSVDNDGFFNGTNPKFRSIESEKQGIFFAGLCRSPSGIRDAINESTSAAGYAYKFLRETDLIQRRTISEVVERWCSGCEFCIEACPFDARYLDIEKKIVKVRELNCVGCGNCVSVCPSGAAKLRGLRDRQMLGMIDVSV